LHATRGAQTSLQHRKRKGYYQEVVISKRKIMKSENPTHLNCPWCPSQSYLQKKFVHDRFAKYMCLLKHEFYIEKNEDTKELAEKSTTQETVMYSENRCKHKNQSGHPADQDIRICHDCDMRSLDGGKKWVTLPWATLPHKKE